MKSIWQKFYPQLSIGHVAIPIVGVVCLLHFVSSAEALVLGVVLALSVGNPYIKQVKNITHTLLGISVMGLGASMNLGVIGRVSLHGIGYTIVGIAFTFLIGTYLGKLLKTEKDTSLLLTVGTAICGGSAIAAVAPVIRAKHHEVSVALGTVFLLNALALFLFPWVGHYFHLSETQFGLWSALAIHDTSSVVGANLKYGAHALEVGTTVKLARALWIIPIALLIDWLRSRNKQSQRETIKPQRPWFILGFVIVTALVTWFPMLEPAGQVIEAMAKRVMVFTLFLIGSGLTRETIKNVGIRPFFQGICLWAIISVVSLWAVLVHWARIPPL